MRCYKFFEVVDSTVLVLFFLELVVDFLPFAALVAVNLVEVVKRVTLRILALDFIDFLGKTASMGRVVGTSGDTLLPQCGGQRLVLRDLCHCCGGEADDGCHE